MKFFTNLTILAIAPAIFAGETTLPVEYNGNGLILKPTEDLGAWNLTAPLLARTANNSFGSVSPRFLQDPQPTQTLGFAGYYSFCSKTPAAIVMQRVGGVTNIFGSKLNPDLSVMLGGDIDGIIRGGGSATLSWTPNNSNLSLIGGLGADWPMTDFELRKIGLGLVLGLKLNIPLPSGNSSTGVRQLLYEPVRF